MKHQKKSDIVWMWEFSKKVVVCCTLIYFAVQLYAMTVMVVTYNYDALSTLIDDCSDILRYCVFGYLIKTAVENVPKIYIGMLQKVSPSEPPAGETDGMADEDEFTNGKGE